MDKKSVTETAADAAKVAVGIAAMAVDALMGADRATEKSRSGTGDVGRQETAEAGGSDQPASKIHEEHNSPETPQSGDSGVGGSGYAPATDASPSEVTSAEAQTPSGAININKAKFDELVSLKHIGRGRAKRIIASRPFRSVEDLASQGIVPADTLAELRNRLAV
jgi:DNA uptake protein ComE-like DNA-binding protein